MSPLRVDYTDCHARSLLAEALHQIGFVVLVNHPIDLNLIVSTYDEWQQFFASQTKHRYTFDPDLQSGYFPLRSETAKGNNQPDLKEFFHLYAWSNLPEGLSDRSWQLFRQLSQLATELLGWIEDLLPVQIQQQLSLSLQDAIAASPSTLMRLLHYPPLTDLETSLEASEAVRAAAHEDINLLTLLPTATAPGLQILDHQGLWHELPCTLGDLAINVGDMLQMATCGYYRSTTHRVINPDEPDRQRSRYSMPLFLHPRPEVMLSANMNAKDYLHQRLQEIGLLKLLKS